MKQATDIGTKARIPNPALKPFEVLIGTWKTVGSHGMLPNVPLQGKAEFEWIENGAFMLMRTEINDSRFPSGIAIFGSDDIQKKFSMHYFDERGVSRLFNVVLENNTFTWLREQPGFSQRCTNTMSEDGNSMSSKGEISKDGSTWEKDLELIYSRYQR